jgi:hypothetical protein
MKHLERYPEMKALKLMGYIAAATVALAVAWNFADLRRYIKIEMM